jgi:hypothetical protein
VTRFTTSLVCPLCTRRVVQSITREEVVALGSGPIEKACGLPDCARMHTRIVAIAARQASGGKPKKATLLRETPLVHACLELLARRGIHAWRQNSGGLKIQGRFDGHRRFKDRYIEFTSEDGISDIVGFIRPSGRVLAVECKITPRPLTADQERFLEKVNTAGGLGLVVYDDVLELDRQLREAGY